MTSIGGRDLLAKAATIRRQQHQSDAAGPPEQHTKSIEPSSSAQISKEVGGEGEELPHDEGWYLEQAIAHLFPPSNLSSTAMRPSDKAIPSNSTDHAVPGDTRSVSSVCPPSPVGFPPAGLDVGACFVAHARLATWYHQRGIKSRNDDGEDSGTVKKDVTVWYESLQHSLTALTYTFTLPPLLPHSLTALFDSSSF